MPLKRSGWHTHGLSFLEKTAKAMKNSVSSMSKIGSRFASIVFVSSIIGAGCVGAETYQHGGSTATIQQSGGSGKSESQIERYQDGQQIITRDGNSTDITIQRQDGSPPSTPPSEQHTQSDLGDSYRRFTEERFSRMDSDDQDGTDMRDDFRQRMLERMGSNFPP